MYSIADYYIDQGIAKGKAEGKAEGKYESKAEIAKKMLSKNKPLEEIFEFTELSIEEIQILKNTIS